MTALSRAAGALLAVTLLLAPASAFTKLPIITDTAATDSFNEYGDAPNTPDADDPAVYFKNGSTLVIGTAKDAGLGVWNLDGRLIQWIAPQYRPVVTEEDPPTPAGVNDVDTPCPNSRDNETYGRFNGVTVINNVDLGDGDFADVAVVTDRGCDLLLFFAIDIEDTDAPLKDITGPRPPRMFPTRVQQPSPFQAGEEAGLYSNPLDDQSTGYGVAAYRNDRKNEFIFVTQRHRSAVAQYRLLVKDKQLTYSHVRLFLFPMVFTLQDADGQNYTWTPCREEPADEDPQSEGVVVDGKTGIMYVAFETLGIYKVDLNALRVDDTVVRVGAEALVDVVKDFGRSYLAVPNEDEFECEYGAESAEGAPEGSVFVQGSDEHVGMYLAADVEGLALAQGKYLLAASQGDNSLHAYKSGMENTYLGGFRVEIVQDTDGLDVITKDLGGEFTEGMLVVHNGAAIPSEQTQDEYNGYTYEGSTQFNFVKWEKVVDALDL